LSQLVFRFSYFGKRGLAGNGAACASCGKTTKQRCFSFYTLKILGFSTRFDLRKAQTACLVAQADFERLWFMEKLLKKIIKHSRERKKMLEERK
jgi:hypothetical protein